MRLRRLLLPVLAGLVALGVLADGVRAHSGVESSTPKSGSTVEEPIDEVFIEFGVRIADDVEIAMLDPDEELMPSVTERVSESAAIVRFDPLVEEGTYIARYLTTEPDAGHILAGAISFNYGDVPGGIGLLTWTVVGLVCLLILAAGAWFSLRLHRAVNAGPDSGDEESGPEAETLLTRPPEL